MSGVMNPKNKSADDGTYNIYYREKGKTRWQPHGSFDWFTHEKPYAQCVEWLRKAKFEHPEREYQIRNGQGKGPSEAFYGL